MLKLRKKEFSEQQQDGMTVNEYLNKFTQMSRYAPNEVNTDEKTWCLPEWAQQRDSVPTSQYRLQGFPEDGRQGYHCQKQHQRDGEEWQEENIILRTLFRKQQPTLLASVWAFL
jgi:hypothetical protein